LFGQAGIPRVGVPFVLALARVGGLTSAPMVLPEAVFFDLDGTLVDNFEAVHKCCNLVEAELGRPLSAYAKVRATVGGSIVLTMQRLVGEDRAPRAVELYGGYFLRHWSFGLTAMPGALWLLGELKKAGVSRAVLTNKNEARSWDILNSLGMGVLLDAVVGTDEKDAARGWRKPNPDFTRYALGRFGHAAERTIMVGDSPFDAETAERAGMPAHMVATGSHSASELEKLPVAGVHADMYELGRAVFGFEPPPGRSQT
jgi:phosphoglycolate phosphatase-like HAD superfamily hydrolase